MLSRRNFIKTGINSAGLLLPGCHRAAINSKKSAHVIIIGGGFGGATAAKYIRKLDPQIKVTLIEAKPNYVTCPASNWVLGGLKSVNDITFNYHSLSHKYGINIVQDFIHTIDPIKHRVNLSAGSSLVYDRLIVSPGIDFRWETIEGYNKQAALSIPHAWKSGEQIQLLKNQLASMRDGGTVVICAPPNPYKCPPGPYERASMMAYYLTRHKPKSKIIILDPKVQFSKQALFTAGWKKHYGYESDNSMIEWVSIPDNPVIKVDVSSKTVETDFGDQYHADVLNIIPAQQAGLIAVNSGLTDSSQWCPVDHATSESTLHPDIHVIGDASIHSPLPKSAFSASSEAKTCAFAIVNLLNDRDLIEPTWINTCYSLITPQHGISIAMVYKLNSERQISKIEEAGGLTIASEKNVYLESKYSHYWYDSITQDSFL